MIDNFVFVPNLMWGSQNTGTLNFSRPTECYECSEVPACRKMA